VGCLKGANSMTVSGLACRKALLGTGRAISVLFGISRLRNKPSCRPRASISSVYVWPFFSATSGWHFLRALIESSLIGGCGWSDVSENAVAFSI